MSIQKAFCFRDAAAEAYFPPFFVTTRGIALRSLMDALSDPTSHLFKQAKDISLFYLGEYDPMNAKFDLLPAPEHVANAWDLKEKVV